MSDLVADRRKLLLFVTGGVVAAALLIVVLVATLGGDGGDDTPAAPSGPIELVASATQEVFTVSGEAGQLPPEDLAAVLDTVEAYLNAAALEAPLVDPRTTTTAPQGARAAGDARPFFTTAAAGRLDTDDILTLTDAHLAPADGASPQGATVDAVAGLVGEDGRGVLVVVTLTVRTLVDLDDDVLVTRTGDIVVELVEGAWRISGYDLSVERSHSSETTTSEAAFRG